MANTIVTISTSGQEFPLPGTHWTVAQVQSAFADNVAGIGSMIGTATTQGEDQLISFSPRTGTKGSMEPMNFFQKATAYVKGFFAG